MKRDENNGLLVDPHDRKRLFRQWVRFQADGTVAAVHEFTADFTPGFRGAVDVTDFAPADFAKVTLTPAVVTAMLAVPPVQSKDIKPEAHQAVLTVRDEIAKQLGKTPPVERK
jgi:hypothetical protein